MTLVIAHRGYKDKYAENTLSAFKGAVEIGVDALETDLQVTKDGVIVLNHDPFTGRTYNKDLVIGDTNLDELLKLENKQDPSEKILVFKDFLEWFTTTKDDLKVILDIKANNDTSILAKIIGDLLQVKNDYSYWYSKITFGLWSLKFYELGTVQTGLLENFEIINITISSTIAFAFLEKSKEYEKINPSFKLSGVSTLHFAGLTREFAKLNQVLIDNSIKLILWTTNTVDEFKLALNLKSYGLITDKPLEAQEYIQSHRDYSSIETNVEYPQEPSIFGKDGLKFRLYRFFEFLVLYNLFRFVTVRKVALTLRKYIL